ncbi:hypothetical protein [Dactylosporangium sp. CA-139066]|uniref:hypothetical protein n=1 Tax=Dactylosporangium sp. CA-139066 TaxID=3239930 RepID=UPI003D9176D2
MTRRRRPTDDADPPAWYANRETAAGIFHRPPGPVGDFDYERYRRAEPDRPPPPASPEPSAEPTVITWLDE